MTGRGVRGLARAGAVRGAVGVSGWHGTVIGRADGLKLGTLGWDNGCSICHRIEKCIPVVIGWSPMRRELEDSQWVFWDMSLNDWIQHEP